MLHEFLTLVLDVAEWLASGTGHVAKWMDLSVPTELEIGWDLKPVWTLYFRCRESSHVLSFA